MLLHNNACISCATKWITQAGSLSGSFFSKLEGDGETISSLSRATNYTSKYYIHKTCIIK